MFSHSYYHTLPHVGPRYPTYPGDLDALAEELEIEAARTRVAARARRGPYSYPEPHYYGRQAHYHPGYDVFEHHEHPLRRPDFRQAPIYPHYGHHEHYPTFERFDDTCSCISRQPLSHPGDANYVGRHSCSPHQHMRQYPSLSPEHHQASCCGQRGCAEEGPEHARWMIEFEPSSSPVSLVPRSKASHHQHPMACARSRGHSEAEESSSVTRDDALSTALNLLGLPVEKRQPQTVSRPVQHHRPSRVLRERLDADNREPEMTPADTLDLDALGAAFGAFLTALSGPSQAKSDSDHVPSSNLQPSVKTEPAAAPKRVSVRFDIPEAPQKAEEHAPVAYTYAVPASAQFSKPISEAASSTPSVSGAKPVRARSQRASDAKAEAQQIMEAIKRSLDPAHNVQPASSSTPDKNVVPVKDNTHPTPPIPIPIPSPANVSTSTPVQIPIRSASPVRPKSPMEAIEAIEQEFVDLEYKFEFPSSVDFLPSASSTPSLAYTSNNMPLRSFEHALTSLLTQLDAVDSAGLEGVRDARKDLVRRIEKVLDELEARKLGIWREQNKVEEAVETPVVWREPKEEIPVIVEGPGDAHFGSSPVEEDEVVATDSIVPESEAVQDAKDDADFDVQSPKNVNTLGEIPLEEYEREDSPKPYEAEDPEYPSYPPLSTADVEPSHSATSSPVMLASDFDPSDMENEKVEEKIIDEF